MKRYRLLALISVLAFTFAAEVQAQASRPKIGLALSGGGAKGAAHVGVLRQLEKMNVPVDYVAGTSMGAVVGALYASGMSPDELQVALETIDWGEALSDATAFEFLNYRRKEEETRYPSTVESGLRDGKLVVPTGIRTGQKLSFLLARFLLPHLDQRDFSKLPIPYAAVAADLETGDAVVLTEGDIAEAVRASMSIPGAFTPVEWGDRILVDGGVTMNVPVEVVRAMGADIVIAIDISAKLPGREKLTSTMDILGQLSGFLTRRNMTPQLAQADLVLTPDITGFTTFDFHLAKDIIARGDAEAIARSTDIAKYAIDPAEHARLVKSQRMARERKVVIDEIRVEGVKFIDERFVRQQMKTKPGDTLDFDKLQKDVEWMYGWGDFIGIHAGLDSSSGKSVLVMRVQEKPWGPAYVRTGLGMETRYNNPGVFLLGNYTRRWINSKGAEWRNDVEFGDEWGIGTEFYQPRGYDRFGFYAGLADYKRQTFRRFEGEDPIGEYDVRQFTLRFDGGTQLGNHGEARIGLFQRWNDADLEVGATDLSEIHEAEGGVRGSLNLITTDDPFFPVRGVRLNLVSIAPLESLGAEHPYITARLESQIFASYGRHVFSGRLFLHDVFDGEAPIYDSAVLGGIENLSGVPFGQLTDQAGAVISLGYRNLISRSSGVFQKVYIGGVVEAGDVYESLSDIDTADMVTSLSGYLGIDTPYGPLVFAVSKAEDFETQYYVQIGRSF